MPTRGEGVKQSENFADVISGCFQTCPGDDRMATLSWGLDRLTDWALLLLCCFSRNFLPSPERPTTRKQASAADRRRPSIAVSAEAENKQESE